VREYRAQLLDHRAQLLGWARFWFDLCGVKP
jgi:hypothetical protein